jgi:hypothetical protein
MKLVFSGVLVFTVGILWGQSDDGAFSFEDMLRDFQDKAVVLDITALVIEKNSEEVWNTSSSKITIPGRPVGVKLVGSNVVAAVQFTPYVSDDGSTFLVVQGQIWVNVPEQGIHYQTTIQTIPIVFGEEVYFFPLGNAAESKQDSRIELRLNLHPYQQQEHGEADESGDESKPSGEDENN